MRSKEVGFFLHVSVNTNSQNGDENVDNPPPNSLLLCTFCVVCVCVCVCVFVLRIAGPIGYRNPPYSITPRISNIASTLRCKCGKA